MAASTEVLNQYFNREHQEFSDLFIQMFVNANNALDYRFFNEFHETTFSHQDINSALKELIGSKVIPFRQTANAETLELSMVWGLFKKAYEFGKYQNARYWIYEVLQNTAVVLPRQMMMGWIAKQRPEHNAKSFAPINDGNLYHASEKFDAPKSVA